MSAADREVGVGAESDQAHPHRFRLTAAGVPLRFPSPAEARGRIAQIRAAIRSSETILVLVAALVGGGAGALVTVMSLISQGAHVVLYGIPLDVRLSAADHIAPWRCLAAPAFGGLALGGIELLRRFTGARTAVDPIEANALRGGRMSLRDSLVVSAQTLISNGCGASVGLEAGYTQIGAGLASRLGLWLRLRRSDLRVMVGAGAAGAISAAFGAPITGAFYAFELVIGAYSTANVAAVFAASLAAWLTSQALGGSPYAFHALQVFPIKPSHYLVVLGLGLIATGLGVSVMKLVELTDRGFNLTRMPTWMRPAVGGLAVGGLALVTPQVLAAGHGALTLDLSTNPPMRVLLILIVLKIAAALISLGSGFRGGLFFASLFVGALVGKLFGEAFTRWWPSYGLDPTACTLAGMGTVAVAIVGGPLTMSFLVLETTGDLSLTAAVLTACVGTSLAVRETFGYSFSTWRLHLRGETIRSAADVGWIRSLTVGRLMRGDVKTVAGSATVAELRRRVPLGSTHMVVAVDEADRYLGLVQVADAYGPDVDAEGLVAKIAKLPDSALLPEMNVKMAMAMFDRTEIETLAVVDNADDKQVIGILTEAYATRRYAEELDKASRGLMGD
jgi:chloride channel protein, CIC family